jgi:glycerol-3-phosphate dehydrogenase subunit B
MNKLVVVGGGIAGVAAAYAAKRRRPSLQITLITGRIGATSLSPGALDETPWDVVAEAEKVTGVSAAWAIDPACAELLVELGIFALKAAGREGDPLERPLVATTGGILRHTLAHASAILDLNRARGRTVLLPAVDRPHWDSASLVRSLNDNAQGLRFQESAATILRFDDESFISDLELARRFDEPERRRWLGQQLVRAKQAHPGEVAFLLGPWLGREADSISVLEAAAGAPVGEIVAPHSGTFGVRFERARARLCERLAITLSDREVASVEQEGSGLVLRGDGQTLEPDCVVLATGGLVGGGIVFSPPSFGAPADGATKIGPSFELSLKGLEGAIATQHGPAFVGSAEGPVLDASAWPRGTQAGALERVGLVLEPDGSLRGFPRVFPAGDIVAGHARTMLIAARAGLLAGERAARVLGEHAN